MAESRLITNEYQPIPHTHSQHTHTQVGQEIEVRPGIVSKTSDGKIQCRPIFSRIVSLFAETNELQYAVPGGLIGRGGGRGSFGDQ